MLSGQCEQHGTWLAPYATNHGCVHSNPESPTPPTHPCACHLPAAAQTLLAFLFKDKKKLSELSRLYRYEDGHILDMAASNGDVKMVQLLLEFGMTVGPSALAHAAHFNHTEVMEVRE